MLAGTGHAWNPLLLDLSLDYPPAMDHPLPEIGDWDELTSWPLSPLSRLSAESMVDVMECREPVCAVNYGESGRSVARKCGELANKTDIKHGVSWQLIGAPTRGLRCP